MRIQNNILHVKTSIASEMILSPSYTYPHAQLATVYCKSFEVEKLCGFLGAIGNHKTFPVI